MPLVGAAWDMVETDAATMLALISTVLVAYLLIVLVPRVDEMTRSYRKFAALTTLGIAYLVLLTLFMAIITTIDGDMTEAVVFSMAVAAFLLFGLTLLYDVADDWLRMFADPEFNTWVELSMVLAVLLVLVISFIAIEP